MFYIELVELPIRFTHLTFLSYVMWLSVTKSVTHVSGEVEAESEDEDDDDDDCKKGSMDEVCPSLVMLDIHSSVVCTSCAKTAS